MLMVDDTSVSGHRTPVTVGKVCFSQACVEEDCVPLWEGQEKPRAGYSVQPSNELEGFLFLVKNLFVSLK